MKITLIALLLALAGGNLALGHGEGNRTAGPNQGRVLHQLEPHAEFLVTPGRKVRLTFLGTDGKPVPVPAGLGATLITGERSAPVTLNFVPEAGSLVTASPLPEGENLSAILRVKPSPKAATLTVRIPLNLAICPGCKRPEYTCTCDH